MKQIFALIGSRRKEGYTKKFVQDIYNKLDKNEFGIEYAHPQDFNIEFCRGCGQCFVTTKCLLQDDLKILQEKILDSDIFIIASPVYLHYMTADLKAILDRMSWWAHTLRLQGKPVVVLSTCSSNGYKTAIEALGKIITFMGGNVIASSNASQMPNQINNKKWLDEVTEEIAQRINKASALEEQSNQYIETVFKSTKSSMLRQEETAKQFSVELGEVKYWRDSGMIDCSSFQEYLDKKRIGVRKKYEGSISAAE